jgi:hypothetical protein
MVFFCLWRRHFVVVPAAVGVSFLIGLVLPAALAFSCVLIGLVVALAAAVFWCAYGVGFFISY